MTSLHLRSIRACGHGTASNGWSTLMTVAEASTRRLKLREEKALLAKPGVAVGLQIGDDLRGRKVGLS